MPDVQRELEDTLKAIVVGLSQNNTSLDRHVSTEVTQPFEDQKIYRTILDENCTNMHQNYYFKIVKIIISQNFVCHVVTWFSVMHNVARISPQIHTVSV